MSSSSQITSEPWNASRSVVRAPTGSENCNWEYAIYRALTGTASVLYYLEGALQPKLRDFRERFRLNMVIHHDASINREALILVMTTEIFRNMLPVWHAYWQSRYPLVDVEAGVLIEATT